MDATKVNNGEAVTETLPTPEEYAAADRAIGEAHEQVELIQMRLRRIAGGWQQSLTGPAPTFEDVGALWSFVDGVQDDAETLGRHGRELHRLLGEVDMMRRDVPLRAGASDA